MKNNPYIQTQQRNLERLRTSVFSKLSEHKNGAHVFFDYKTGWQIRPVGQALGKELGVKWL